MVKMEKQADMISAKKGPSLVIKNIDFWSKAAKCHSGSRQFSHVLVAAWILEININI